ncbi:unnamed protein product [Pelagomonas calceolata]|uniref:Uncharacterized protein n=1 Tax=Pelagomonas calceolata TaxID=35677 RepID=A0A8J2SFB7_9STRA|nr:unnamed protein product [Pelagomonas calceolata]
MHVEARGNRSPNTLGDASWVALSKMRSAAAWPGAAMHRSRISVFASSSASSNPRPCWTRAAQFSTAALDDGPVVPNACASIASAAPRLISTATPGQRVATTRRRSVKASRRAPPALTSQQSPRRPAAQASGSCSSQSSYFTSATRLTSFSGESISCNSCSGEAGARAMAARTGALLAVCGSAMAACRGRTCSSDHALAKLGLSDVFCKS